jgi:hypothetical protein
VGVEAAVGVEVAACWGGFVIGVAAQVGAVGVEAAAGVEVAGARVF